MGRDIYRIIIILMRLIEMKKFYSKKFYDHQMDGSVKSAREILPLVLKLIKPKTVVDVGCGVGSWLSVFKELGINDILGLDGDWVDKEMLLIPKEDFVNVNLVNSIKIDKKFDLAVSLEVAEHLPAKNADDFINFLTELAPVILFSAAIPFQGGENHINEQWPEYWVKRFTKKNYNVMDCIRSEIWNNNNVEPFYAQNIFLFVKEDYIEKSAVLKKEIEKNNEKYFSIVHPGIYLHKLQNHELIIFKSFFRLLSPLMGLEKLIRRYLVK